MNDEIIYAHHQQMIKQLNGVWFDLCVSAFFVLKKNPRWRETYQQDTARITQEIYEQHIQGSLAALAAKEGIEVCAPNIAAAMASFSFPSGYIVVERENYSDDKLKGIKVVGSMGAVGAALAMGVAGVAIAPVAYLAYKAIKNITDEAATSYNKNRYSQVERENCVETTCAFIKTELNPEIERLLDGCFAQIL